MSVADSMGKGALVLQTVVAFVLAAVTYMIVATLAGIALGVVFMVLGEWGPFLGRLIALGFGGVAGVYAARGACDMALRAYSWRTICILFVVINAAVVIAAIALLPNDLEKLFAIVQPIVTMGAAWQLFWVEKQAQAKSAARDGVD